MLKIVKTDKPEPPVVKREILDIGLGTVFTGSIGTYSGVFLRIYDGVVLLPNQATWRSLPYPLISNYVEVEATLTYSTVEAKSEARNRDELVLAAYRVLRDHLVLEMKQWSSSYARHNMQPFLEELERLDPTKS